MRLTLNSADADVIFIILQLLNLMHSDAEVLVRYFDLFILG